MGMVTQLHTNHFQVLLSFISTLHSTGHTVRHQPPVQGIDVHVMVHSGMDKTTTKVVIVGLKFSSLGRFQDRERHLQVHQECLQDRR